MNYDVESLKTLGWEKQEEGNFIVDVNDAYFWDMTTMHVPSVRTVNKDAEIICKLQYVKLEGKCVLYARMYKDTEIRDCIYEENQQFEDDVLGLFAEEEKKQKQSLEDFLKSDNFDPEEFLEQVKAIDREAYDSISNHFEESVMNNLDESQKEDIADEWIGDNTDDAWQKVLDEVSDYTIREFVKDYIQDNL